MATAVVCGFLIPTTAVTQGNSAPPDSSITKPSSVLSLNQTNGYAVWFNSDPTIKYWEVVVRERTALTDSTSKDVVVWQHQEWRNNYVFIPEMYRPEGVYNQYGITLYGWSANNEVIVQDELIELFGCVGFEAEVWYDSCFSICNAPNYAWKVTQLVSASGNKSKYMLSGASYYDPEAVDDVTGEIGMYVPYYQYMTHAEYNSAFLGNPTASQEFYDISTTAWQFLDSYDQYYTRTIDNTPSINYYTASGTLIQDPTLMGVRKAMGHWNGVEYPDRFTGEFSYGFDGTNSLCMNNTTAYAATLMNASGSNIWPTLTCAAQSQSSNPGSGWAGDLSNCTEHLLTYEDDGETIGSAIQNWLDCIENLDPSGTGGTGGSVWELVEHIHLIKVNDDGMTGVFSRSKQQLFDAQGNFIPFSVVLEPGLYRLELTHEALGTFNPEAFFEVKTKEAFEVTMADLFDFTIFPVPHIEDGYNINMVTSANMKVKYKLFDFQANKLHEVMYNLDNNHNADHKITPRHPLPEGLLLHRFEFSDGSFLTATTIRSEN